MGYKSILKSAVAASDKAAREAKQRERQDLKEIEKMQRKIATVNEKIRKVIQALEDIYAKGKIDEDQYKKLKQRESDISLDLIAIAKTPGISLAKRYITGAIDKDEFEKIQKDLLPPDLFEERRIIYESIGNIEKELKEFRDNCKNDKENECRFCGKEKSLFSPLKIEDGLRLCGKCKSRLLNLQNYKGFSGNYFTVSPMKITFSDVDDGIKMDIELRQELL